MKKVYMTPMVAFSNSNSATTFAAKCVFQSNHDENKCPVNMGDLWGDGDTTILFQLDSSCTITPEDYGGKICYQAPTSTESIFAS